MPKITKRERLTAMYEAILSLSSAEDCQHFFEDLCSPAELSAMEQRFAVADLLMQDKVYTEILSRTNASTSTISRVKRVLTDGTGALQQALEQRQAAQQNNTEETHEN